MGCGCHLPTQDFETISWGCNGNILHRLVDGNIVLSLLYLHISTNSFTWGDDGNIVEYHGLFRNRNAVF